MKKIWASKCKNNMKKIEYVQYLFFCNFAKSCIVIVY